jgi:hypothetical protein
MPNYFKGTVFQKNSIGNYIMAEEEQYNFSIIFKKIFLSADMKILKNMLNDEKVEKLSISQLIIEQHEKNFRSSLSILDRFD